MGKTADIELMSIISKDDTSYSIFDWHIKQASVGDDYIIRAYQIIVWRVWNFIAWQILYTQFKAKAGIS